jgi:hypothetical protein
MKRKTPTRTLPATSRSHVCLQLVSTLAFLLLAQTSWASGPHERLQQNSHPAPIVRQAPEPQRPAPPTNEFARRSGQNQEHLQQWMQSHSNLTLEQQQHALDNEPGFRQLKPEMQQRMHQRLAQLNGMTPQQRQRAFERTEAMERLAPEQRQQVRNALTSLGTLPKDRRMYVAREFRAMRDMPPAERQAFLNSPAMHAQFSDQERQTLNGLFEVESYLPPPPQPAPAMQGPMPPR